MKSKNAIEQKLSFEFPRKKDILALIMKIEKKRNILCYGKPQSLELLEQYIKYFRTLKNIETDICCS